MRTLLAVGAIALLAACGSNRTNSSLLNEEDAPDAENWFCQPGAVGEDWDCDRYMASDPVPKPTRGVGVEFLRKRDGQSRSRENEK